MINWSKVTLYHRGCLALAEPPPLAQKHPSILYCEEVNYLLWKYGYLDKGYTLADINEDFGYGHRCFIESLFCKYYNLSDNICEISKEVWNARVKD